MQKLFRVYCTELTDFAGCVLEMAVVGKTAFDV
jgi:hypothetical protein